MKVQHKFTPAQHGFSLVELMVAVVIGLIGTLVMFQLFAVSEGQKRTTVGGGEAQQNGAIALFTMERDLRNSAHGVTYLIDLGLPVQRWNNGPNSADAPSIFKPVLITPTAGGQDSIDLAYSTSTGVSAPVALSEPWDPAAAADPTIKIVNEAGIKIGDMVAICTPKRTPPLASDMCVQGQVTAIPPVGNSVTLNGPGTNFVQNGQVKNSKVNPAAPFASAFSADGITLPAEYYGDADLKVSSSMTNLGSRLEGRSYSVQNDSLMLTDDSGVAQEFADGIVGLRAQYGLDTDNNGAVDAWVNPRGAMANPLASYTPDHPSFLTATSTQIATGWRMVLAIRVAIVARSGVLEKTVTESRSSIPLWTNPAGNIHSAPSFIVPGGDGNRYRYQVFETIVPFRNMIWRP